MADLAAHGTIIAGASLFSTSMEQMSDSINTDRNVTVTIRNYSENYILRKPRVYNLTGYSHNPPQPTIKKATLEPCSFTKDPSTNSGYTGVLMYEAAVGQGCDTVCCVAIMLSVPQDYKNYGNLLALGIFSADQSCDEALYKMMYYSTPGPFVRDNSSGNEFEYEVKEHRIKVKGIMSPRAKALAKIELWDI